MTACICSGSDTATPVTIYSSGSYRMELARERSLSDSTVKKLPCRVGMTGVACCLIDQVEQHPAEVPVLAPVAWLGERLHRSDCRVRRNCPFSIGNKGSIQRE